MGKRHHAASENAMGPLLHRPPAYPKRDKTGRTEHSEPRGCRDVLQGRVDDLTVTHTLEPAA